MGWSIVKKGYSRSPWRIITDGGHELAVVDAESGIYMPVCGDTRTAVEAWILDRCEWYAWHARNGQLPTIYRSDWRTTAMVSNTAKGESP